MRLTIKLTFALSIVIAGGLIAQSLLHIRRVQALHAAETRDDMKILARALASATSEIWGAQGEARARAYISAADAERARTRIRMVTPEQGPQLSGGAPSPVQIGPRGLTIYIDAIGDRGVLARLELVRARSDERKLARGLLWTQIATVAAVLGACGALALVLGLVLVGRPVERLVEHARRVARGDFTPAEMPRTRDEIGRLAAEMTSMSDHLAAAQARARTERKRRAQAFEQLRHADRLSTVGKLASGIAHELGTPLNVVAGRAAFIAADPEASESVKKSARTIAAQSEHMTAILRQLLDFSRRRGVASGPAEPRELLEHAAMLVEPLAEEQGVNIELAEAEELAVTIDERKTLQVLTNLLVNAIGAMPGGGTVTLSASLQRVDAPTDRHAAPGQFVCFSVRDQGMGIATEDLDRIFEPFFTTKGTGEGTGLGLSVCHEIVREHGGWIEVESEPGHGSDFRVYLPIDQSWHAAPQARPGTLEKPPKDPT